MHCNQEAINACALLGFWISFVELETMKSHDILFWLTVTSNLTAYVGLCKCGSASGCRQAETTKSSPYRHQPTTTEGGDRTSPCLLGTIKDFYCVSNNISYDARLTVCPTDRGLR